MYFISTVSCRSSICEHTVTSITTVPATRRSVLWVMAHKSTSLCTPLALLTNGLSLIIFARMYRAKQQVINGNNYVKAVTRYAAIETENFARVRESQRPAGIQLLLVLSSPEVDEFVENPRTGVVYITSVVSVCVSDDNFRKHQRRKFQMYQVIRHQVQIPRVLRVHIKFAIASLKD